MPASKLLNPALLCMITVLLNLQLQYAQHTCLKDMKMPLNPTEKCQLPIAKYLWTVEGSPFSQHYIYAMHAISSHSACHQPDLNTFSRTLRWGGTNINYHDFFPILTRVKQLFLNSWECWLKGSLVTFCTIKLQSKLIWPKQKTKVK